MAIDWIYLILVILFFLRGYKKGIIISLFSIIALLVGIAAALKLSQTFVVLLSEKYPTVAKWTPIFVYIIVFLIVAWIVRLFAKFLEKSVEMAALGWLNKIAGGLLYIFLISIIFSLFLWLLTRMGTLSAKEIAASHTYSTLEPLAPKIFKEIGKVIPLFKDSFQDLSNLFGKLNQHLP